MSPEPTGEDYYLWPARGDRRKSDVRIRTMRETRLLQVFVACALLALLMGCASLDYEWIQTRPASVKPWTYIVVADAESECAKSGMQAASGRRLIACAHWRPANCEIILPIGYQQWIKEHEEQHCEGMTHK